MDKPDLQTLLYHLHRTRQIGKTTSAIELAKKNNAILICINGSQARKISSETGVQAISMNKLYSIRGTSLPIVLDQDVITSLIENMVAFGSEGFHAMDDLIRANLSFALTSPNEYVRTRAEELADDNT